MSEWHIACALAGRAAGAGGTVVGVAGAAAAAVVAASLADSGANNGQLSATGFGRLRRPAASLGGAAGHNIEPPASSWRPAQGLRGK